MSADVDVATHQTADANGSKYSCAAPIDTVNNDDDVIGALATLRSDPEGEDACNAVAALLLHAETAATRAALAADAEGLVGVALLTARQDALRELRTVCLDDAVAAAVAAHDAPLLNVVVLVRGALALGDANAALDAALAALTAPCPLATLSAQASCSIATLAELCVTTALPAAGASPEARRAIAQLRAVLADDSSFAALAAALRVLPSDSRTSLVVALEACSSSADATRDAYAACLAQRKRDVSSKTSTISKQPASSSSSKVSLSSSKATTPRATPTQMRDVAKPREGESYTDRLARMRQLAQRRQSKSSTDPDSVTNANNATTGVDNADDVLAPDVRSTDRTSGTAVSQNGPRTLLNVIRQWLRRVWVMIVGRNGGSYAKTGVGFLLAVVFAVWRLRRSATRNAQQQQLATLAADYIRKRQKEGQRGRIQLPASLFRDVDLLPYDWIDKLYQLVVGGFLGALKLSFGSQPMQ